MGSVVRDTLAYIKNFIKDRNVASVMPSTKFLVRRVCSYMDFTEPRVVVEYGPGMGVFSTYLLEHLPPESHLILIETNENFAEKLHALEGDAKVSIFLESAENVEAVMQEAGEERADYVLSGIPFSFFDDVTRHELIRTTRSILKDGGKFLVYQHYNHMEKPLRQHFEEVHTDFEPINLPPIHIQSAVKHERP